jgi:uncharacterized membrane protein YphA (DoxX/SURF4 family)
VGAVVAFAAGAALLTGLFTGAAALAAALISSIQTIAFVSDADASAQTSVFVVVLLVSVAIVLLGPGAFSIDSYRFGRREIVIPGEPPSSRH